MSDAPTTTEPVRRRFCYVQPPSMYGIAPCACGNVQTQWSEFVDLLYCDKCQKDFTPEHWGIFDGPIPVETAQLLGICFDRYEIATGRVVKFEAGDAEYNATRP